MTLTGIWKAPFSITLTALLLAFCSTPAEAVQAGAEKVDLVIENTLRGTAVLLGRESGVTVRKDDAKVTFDQGGYTVTNPAGASVRIDARTGAYKITASDRAAAAVRPGLDALGKVIREAARSATSSRAAAIALSESERDALALSWRAAGLGQSQIDAYAAILRQAAALEQYAREIELRVADIEKSARELEAQVETEARDVEREAEKVEEGARDVETTRAPRGAVVFCEANDELVLSGRTIETDGLAVHAQGNCEILIENSVIVSRSVAVRAEGNAHIEIRDSRIEGREAAITYGGNAEVEASDSELIGAIHRSGNAEFRDKGGNTIRRQ